MAAFETAFDVMTKPIETKVADNGLRYASKATGSPFAGSGQTMSCFRCGRHRPATQLHGQRFLGRVQRVCKPSCGSEQ